MPNTYTWEQNGVYRQFTGELSGDEILASNLEINNNHNFKAAKYIINDFSKLTSHSIDVIHTKAIAVTDDILCSSKGQLKIALIVTQPDIVELANSYREQMHNNIFECEIFSTLKDAREWVNTT